MRYVGDASVALTAVLPGPFRGKALQLQTDYQMRFPLGYSCNRPSSTAPTDSTGNGHKS